MPVARAERLISTAVLSFVVSEAAGGSGAAIMRLPARTSQSAAGGRAALLSAAPDGPVWCVLAC